MSATTTTTDRYLRPGWFTRHLINRLARRLARLGVSPKGLRQLSVRGRRTGEWRTTAVNLLELEGQQYLVAPRGLTEWVRNIRVAGGGELRVGRTVEVIEVDELVDVDKPAVLREYLRRWKAEVKMFFEGIDEDSTDAQLREIAPGFPVFAVRSVGR